MGISEELDRFRLEASRIGTTKMEIKAAILAQGVTVGDVFSEYPAAIGLIAGDGEPLQTAPVITSPTLSPATVTVGGLVTASAEVTGSPAPVLSYVWALDDVTIEGADGPSIAAPGQGVLTCVITAANVLATVSAAAGPVTVNPVPVTPLKSSVEALETTAGRKSVAALKVPGVDALPSGVSLSGSIITMTGDGATFEDWDLRNYYVQMNGADQVIRDCLLGEPDGVAGILYYVQTGGNATNPTIEDCDIFGFDGVGGSGTFINQQRIGDDLNPSIASGLTIRGCHFKHGDGDYLKLSGDNFLVEQNFFDVVSCYPEGTPTWPAGSPYTTGDAVLNSAGFLFIALADGALAEPPARKTDVPGVWDARDPHNDLITVRGAIGDGYHIIRNNLFADHSTARSPGMTQQIRYVRNTGTPIEGNRLEVVGNVFREWGGIYPFAQGGVRPWFANTNYPLGGFCEVGGIRYESLITDNQGNDPETSPAAWTQTYDVNFEGPGIWRHNWMSQGSTGAYYASGVFSGSLTIWADNLDLDTLAEVPPPDDAVVKTSLQPPFGTSGIPPVLPEYGPSTSFDITPTSYETFSIGGSTILACALSVGGQVVAYIDDAGTATLVDGKGFTLETLGSGSWRLSTAAGVEQITVKTLAGGANVSESGDTNETVVIGILGQSQMEYLVNPGGVYGQIADPLVPATPNVTAWTDTTATGSGAPLKTVVTRANVAAGLVNPVIANWSAFWHRVAPGSYFHVVDLCVPGTGRASLADDGNAEARWPAFSAMLAAVRAEGLEFDAIIENWQANDSATAKTFPECWSPFYFGQRWNGSAFTLGNVNPDMTSQTSTVFDNCLWDVTAASDAKGRGVFTRDRTKLWFSGWPTFSGHSASPLPEQINFSADASGGPESGYPSQLDRPARDRLEEFLADGRVATFAGGLIGGAHIADMAGGVHPVRNHPDGQILMSIGIAAAALAVAGYTISDPTIGDAIIPAGGAYADIEVLLPNGGDLTTVRALEGRAGPAVEPPHYQPVMGFEIRRDGDTDAERRPVYKLTASAYPAAYRGTVAILDPGSGSPRKGKIRITPEVPFTTGDVIEFDRGDASAILLTPRDVDAKIYLNQPIESVPAWRDLTTTYPFPGIAVRPQPPTITLSEGATTGTGPANTVAPLVSGGAVLGETLFVSNGTWTGDAPITYTRQWRRGGVAITGATGSSYTTVPADVGALITCAVTATNQTAAATQVSSNSVGPITADVGNPPVNTVAPVVSGTTGIGDTLSCTTGTWTGDATITYSYQWRRNGAAISGATSATYDLVADDSGTSILCSVTADNGVGTPVRADSNAVTAGGGAAFFTVRPLGPYHVDPSNVPANTTRIEYEARIRLGAHPSSGQVVSVATQESTGCDIQIGFSAGGAVWRCVVEDGDGTKMISGASSFSEVPAAGTWFKLKFDANMLTEEAIISVDDVVVDTIPFIATPSPATFQSNREIAFFATTGGNSGTATGGVGTVDCEYIEAYFTTGGSRTLRKRIDPTNVNSDAWKRGADAI